MSSKPVEWGQGGNKAASPAESQSRRIEAALDFGATATDVARPLGVPWLRRNATEAISQDPLGRQLRQAEPFTSQATAAGVTQLIDVPGLAIQPHAIIEIEVKQGSSAPQVLGPLVSIAKQVAPAEVVPMKAPNLSFSPALILSPTEAGSSRSASSPKFEAVSLPRAMAAANPLALSTVLDAPVVRLAATRGRPEPARRGSIDRAPCAVAKLGILTQRYPVGVIGGVAVGAMMLAVSLVGAAHLLGLRSRTPDAIPVSRAALQAAVVVKKPVEQSFATASGSATPVRRALNLSASGAPNVPPSPPSAPATAQTAATETDPSLPVAVGHLFSGRLLEAEQAYRALAVQHPEEPTYQALSRLLARRNGPDCRPGNPMQKACPAVKP